MIGPLMADRKFLVVFLWHHLRSILILTAVILAIQVLGNEDYSDLNYLFYVYSSVVVVVVWLLSVVSNVCFFMPRKFRKVGISVDQFFSLDVGDRIQFMKKHNLLI